MLHDIPGLTETHPEYDGHLDAVETCRDCVDGARAIKAKTTRYFPALLGETPRSVEARILLSTQQPRGPLDGQYEKRLMLAAVYTATDKTLDALLGALFRSASTPTLPEPVVRHLANIDLAGTAYDAFKQQAGQEVLEAGRYGVLVDWSQEQRRPFWRPYETEQIDNWRYGIRNGRKVLEQIKLREAVTERSSSGFGGEVVERFRVLALNDAGQVEATTYTKRTGSDGAGGTSSGYEVDGPAVLHRQGVALTEIPFVCFGRLDLDLCPQKPPLVNIAELQLDHFRLDGDVKWAIHVGCMGGLFVIGDGDPDRPKQYFFGGAANRLAEGASVIFATLPPDMVDRARAEKATNEQRMALMGARMLLAPKREAETAEAALIQRDGESASLTMLSRALSTALTQCWRFHAIWMGLSSEGVGDDLPRDFFPHRLTPDEIRVQLEAHNAGHLSTETLLENLYAGQIAREPEVERERLAAEPMAGRPGDGRDLDESVDDDEDAPPVAA